MSDKLGPFKKDESALSGLDSRESKENHSELPWDWELIHVRNGWEKQYTPSQRKSMEDSEWKNGNIAIRNFKGKTILRSWGDDGNDGLNISEADRAYIIEACNNYEALKKRCEELESTYKIMITYGEDHKADAERLPNLIAKNEVLKKREAALTSMLNQIVDLCAKNGCSAESIKQARAALNAEKE